MQHPIYETTLLRSLDELIAQIPAGHVATFGDLALSLGEKKAAIWVFQTIVSKLHAAYETNQKRNLPLYRVVKSTGELPFVKFWPESRELLQAEGIRLTKRHLSHRSMLECRVSELRLSGEPPFRQLNREQDRIASAFTPQSLGKIPSCIAAMDIAFPSPDVMRAACVIWDVHTRSVIETLTHEVLCTFPYITGYLAFRELPGYLALLQHARESLVLPDLILVDGQGILHPRRAGIAVHLGVMTGYRTIGVGKSRLAGKAMGAMQMIGYAKGQHLELHQEMAGIEITHPTKKQKLFISPGQRMDVAGCLKLYEALQSAEDLCPPITIADRLSKGKRI